MVAGDGDMETRPSIPSSRDKASCFKRDAGDGVSQSKILWRLRIGRSEKRDLQGCGVVVLGRRGGGELTFFFFFGFGFRFGLYTM